MQQQSDLSLHRVRQGFVQERTATFNRIRGLLAEFGYVLPKGFEQLRRQVPGLDGSTSGTDRALRAGSARACERLRSKALEYEREIRIGVRDNSLEMKLSDRAEALTWRCRRALFYRARGA